MKKIKLVMSDLDDTLLKENSYVSDKDEDMLNHLIADGVEVIPTTGRHLEGIPEYFFKHEGIRYLIGSNGAQIYDKHTKELLLSSDLDKEIVLQILKQADHKARFIGVVTPDGLLVDGRIKDDVDRRDSVYFTRIIEAGNVRDDMIAFVEKTDTVIYKINLAFDDLAFRDELYQNLKADTRITAEASSVRNVEVVDATTSKGSALNFMLDYLDLKKEEVLAIGDNDNDVTMIQNAGIGIAMGNASEYVKSHSDTVTLDNHDDGFAHAIKKVFKY